MDLGSTLQNARERTGLSLSDIAARTRIPLKSLRAIEANNFAVVPAGIFVRGFIRSYAREVGVEPEAAIAEYRAMTEPAEEPAPKLKEEPPVDDDVRSSSFDPELLTSSSGPGWGYALIAAALLITVISVNRYNAAGPSETPASAPTPPASKITATPTVTPEVPQPVATAGDGVRVELRAGGLCWVKAVADGQTVVFHLLQPGETHSITAQRDVVLRVGDPAALSYTINGRPGQPLGAAQIPVTVRVDAAGQVSLAS